MKYSWEKCPTGGWTDRRGNYDNFIVPSISRGPLGHLAESQLGKVINRLDNLNLLLHQRAQQRNTWKTASEYLPRNSNLRVKGLWQSKALLLYDGLLQKNKINKINRNTIRVKRIEPTHQTSLKQLSSSFILLTSSIQTLTKEQ